MINKLLFWLNGYEVRRKRLLDKVPEGPLREFLSVPFPTPETLIEDTPILSVDFETTGLHAINDKLLSVGCVSLEQGQIKLPTCYHQVIRSKGELKASNVVIHQITDDIKERGAQLAKVVEALLAALAGKVMLVHFGRIEKQFLAQACIELYGMAPVYPMIDTLALAKRRFDKSDTPYDPSELRLSNLRDRYQLPRHYAHNALSDAVATAELLLALIHHKRRKHPARLQDFLL